MIQSLTPQIFIYSALPCEAKPLVEHFDLKKDTSISPFAMYFNKQICLTVTGLGKNAMSAGVAYSQALFGSNNDTVMVNIGIAGHQSHQLGRFFLIDKIIDADTGRHFYPPLVVTPTCSTAGIQSASKPQLNYDQQYLCDMESSAFYETATRFSSAELVHCLKIISDNKHLPAENIQAKHVSLLITEHLTTIETILSSLNLLAISIALPEPSQFAPLIERYRFTASEQGQLKNLLSRWDTLTEHRALEFDQSKLQKGKDVLVWLNRQINELECWV